MRPARGRSGQGVHGTTGRVARIDSRAFTGRRRRLGAVPRRSGGSSRPAWIVPLLLVAAAAAAGSVERHRRAGTTGCRGI